MKKPKGPTWLKINSQRNSDSSVRLCDLDWSNWWTDGGFIDDEIYLHVQHKHYATKGHDWEGTVHRVYCLAAKGKCRIGMRNGELYWLI